MRRRYFIFRRRSSLTALLVVLFCANTGFTKWNMKAEKLHEPVISLYDQLRLAELGLSRDAFNIALKGFQKLEKEEQLQNHELLSIADFSKSSAEKRLYVIDLAKQAVLFHTYVSHGRNSGMEYARAFGNREGSYMSSLGFYRTGEIYQGQHGPSLRLVGLEKGINHRALERGIVIHGADYVSEDFIARYGRLGRSQGCPAVPQEECTSLVHCLKGGSCLYVYYPDSGYFRSSPILSGYTGK